MLGIRCEIHITQLSGARRKFVIDYCSEIEIEHSIKDPVSIARIVLPRNLQYKGRRLTGTNDSYFSVGDYVQIGLGYEGVLGGGTAAQMRKWVFTGYISKVLPKAPIELVCMNDLWALMRKSAVSKTLENYDFSDILKFYTQGTEFENITEIVPKGFDFVIDKFTVKQGATFFSVLKQLTEDYGLEMLFRPFDNATGQSDRLFIGQIYLGQLHKRTPSPTVITNAHFIADNLQYQKEEDVLLRVRGLSYNEATSKRIEEYGGDEVGDLRTLYFLNLTREELQAAIQRQVQRLKYTGYSGTFTCFGEPYVRPADALNLKDTFQMKPEGLYLIKSVRHRFGDGIGWKQEIELDRKL